MGGIPPQPPLFLRLPSPQQSGERPRDQSGSKVFDTARTLTWRARVAVSRPCTRTRGPGAVYSGQTA